jgi:hypothetical protein
MSPPAIASRPVKSVWDPPLSERYFTKIQSFRIELLFHDPINYAPYKPPESSTSTSDAEKQVLELRTSHYCDQLHRLIGRLQLRQRPISRLEITIKFSITYVAPSSFPIHKDVFFAVCSLLQPFQRLCKVAKPRVLSITINDFQNRERKLLFGRICCAECRSFAKYLARWPKALSSSQPSFKCEQVLEAYWRLESLLSSIQGHCDAEPRFFQFAELLQAARIARELNNIERFRKIWDRVVTIWFEYLEGQEYFQSSVARSIDAINGIVEKGS